MLRRRRPASPLEAVDPAAVAPHLRQLVDDALAARQRWVRTAERFASGPLQDRARALTSEVDAGVLAIWAGVQRVLELERVIREMDPARITDDYKRAKRSGSSGELLTVLEAKHRSAQRLLNAVEDATATLRLLDARLGAAVLQATDLLLTGDAAEAGTALGEVVDELTLLQATMGQLDP